MKALDEAERLAAIEQASRLERDAAALAKRARDYRDELIRAAVAADCSRVKVAAAAGVARARLYQII